MTLGFTSHESGHLLVPGIPAQRIALFACECSIHLVSERHLIEKVHPTLQHNLYMTSRHLIPQSLAEVMSMSAGLGP